MTEDKTRLMQSTPLKSTELQVGEELGRYKIEKFLGRGGMGTVYQAHDPILKRSVAIKLLNTEFAGQESFVKRFDREAENLAKLKHDGVVKVLDRGFDRSWPYLVMELVEGESLRQEMNKGKLPLDRCLSLLRDLAETLEYSHASGVVHRDIKPENILIQNESKKPLLTDFGLSKTLQHRVVETQITMTNILMGTLDYMSPEQRRNKGEVNYKSDLYSLGVVFYEMLTGNLPVGAFEKPSANMGCSKWVDEVVMKLLATESHKRYSSAADVLRDINNLPQHGELKPSEPMLPHSPGFNWIALLQVVMVLLVIVAEFPFSWMLIGVVLLSGIQANRQEKHKIARGEIKEEYMTPRFVGLSVGYWISLLCLMFLCSPHQDNWQNVENYFSPAGTEVALERSSISASADEVKNSASEVFSGFLNDTPIQQISILEGVISLAVLGMGLMAFSYFVLKPSKNKDVPLGMDMESERDRMPVKKVKPSGIYRNLSDKWFGGVCSGLAHKLNLSVGGVRFITLISILFFGLPVLVYVLVWILLPGYKLDAQ